MLLSVSIHLLDEITNCLLTTYRLSDNTYRVRQKSNPLKFFCSFLSNRLELQLKILHFYLLKRFTSNCDSVEKR